MNNLKFTAGLIVVVLALILVPAIFAQDAPIQVSVPDGGVAVNVRSGPGLEYTLHGVLSGSLNATGRNGFSESRLCRGLDSDLDMWIRIEFKGFEGWVARCAVAISASPNSLPVVGASNPVLISSRPPRLTEPESESIEKAPDGTYLIGYTLDRVNVRTAPGLGSDIMAVAPYEEDVFVIGRSGDNNWLRVVYNGEAGWIATYLMLMPHNWQTTLPVQ